MVDEKSICLICGNFDGETCMEQRIDTLKGLVIMSCPDYYKEGDFKRDEYGNPICETCGGDLVLFGAEPGDVQAMCPTCDNSPPETEADYYTVVFDDDKLARRIYCKGCPWFIVWTELPIGNRGDRWHGMSRAFIKHLYEEHGIKLPKKTKTTEQKECYKKLTGTEEL